MSVQLEGDEIDENGFLISVAPVKSAIREICQELDERVVVPEHNPHLVLTDLAESVSLVFGSRRYVLPRAEVCPLPIENSTMEALSRYLWVRLAPTLPAERVTVMTVAVEETRGQRAEYRRRLPPID